MLVHGARGMACRRQFRRPHLPNRPSGSRIRRISFEPRSPTASAAAALHDVMLQAQHLPPRSSDPAAPLQLPAEPNPENPEDNPGFTVCETLFMIGARNFFIPNERADSIYCIDCYKRGGFHISLILVVVCMFLLSNAVLHPLPMVGRQVFIAKAYQDMFVTDQDYYPIFATLFVYLIMIMAGWTVHYTQKPTYDSGFFLYLNTSRALLVIGSAILVWHVWAHAAHYPDEKYVTRLEMVMQETLKLVQHDQMKNPKLVTLTPPAPAPATPNTVATRVWDDTQAVFKCCGIKSHQDWFPPAVAPESVFRNFSTFVPRSCCTETGTDSSCEAMFVHKEGCLQAQLKGLTGESLWIVNPGLFLVFFTYLSLYLIIGRLFSNTAAVTRTARIFDLPLPPPRQADPRPRHPI